MERESTTHGPRIDEALAHRVDSLTRGSSGESRSEEALLEEDPGEEVHMDPGRRPDVPPPGGLAPEEVDTRSELARYVAGAEFPADRSTLLDVATRQNAPAHVMDVLNALPDDQTFVNVQEVWQAVGGHVEGHHP